jgi:hypothetical protein
MLDIDNWNTGILEDWNNGILDGNGFVLIHPIISLFHRSFIPFSS